MEDFYIECKSEEESALCEKWAVNNSLSSKNIGFEYTKEWCYFIVENNEYTLNDAETYNLPEKTLADLGINTTTEKDWSKVSWAEVISTPEVKETISDSKFIVGKWYCNSEKTYAKVDSIIDYDNFNFKEWITNGIYCLESNSWGNHPKMREASLEEIHQYLPDGHPDKIPDKVKMKSKEKPEFKIGDWVTVVDSDNSYSNYRKAIGYTFQICGDLDEFYFNEFINGEESAIDPINKYGVNYRLKDIRKATPEEIDSVTKPKEITEYAGLKIGDKLPRNIICDWGEIGINKYFNGWEQQKGMFISDRYIKAFKELDGIVGFLVSGTNNVYLKADGFKEFMDSYSRPINTQPIKTTSEQYDLYATITRAVKNNDPSIIARETGKSIDELCELVDKRNGNCLCPLNKCEGLLCSTDNCPFSQLSCKTKESAKAWLRSKSKQLLSDYDAVHVDSQEKWDFVSEKLGYTSRWVSSSKWSRYKKNSCINLEEVGFGTEEIAYSKVISFEDWLDLTGYRSEWDMFFKKPTNVRYYMSYPLTPVECVKEKPEFSLFPNFVSKIN